jgi:hypothetical protein
MFDVQTRKGRGEAVPPEVLSSIAAYYRRVTTDARPMNRLVGLVMLLTLLAIGAEIVENRNPVWLEAVSLACALSAIGLAVVRTFRKAVALGAGEGTLKARSHLARSIYRDHLYCLASIATLIVLQLAAR